MPPHRWQPVAGGIMFSGCLSVCTIPLNAISQEYLDRISSNLAKIFTRSRSWWPHKAHFWPCEGNISGMPSRKPFTFCTNIPLSLDFILVAQGQRSRSQWPHKVCSCFSWTWYLKIILRECLQVWCKLSVELKDELIRFWCLEVKG